MAVITVPDAAVDLEALLARVEAGEVIVVVQGGLPVARWEHVEYKSKRQSSPTTPSSTPSA